MAWRPLCCPLWIICLWKSSRSLSPLPPRDLTPGSVYEPSDDTYLLCDSLLNDKDLLATRSPTVCVEIGSGSGCVITYLGQLLQSLGIRSYLLATDININALLTTKLTAQQNNVNIDCVQCSLLCGLEGLHHKMDVILFNPPYVPTPDEEISGCGIEASWAGGTDGRVIIDRSLPVIKEYLSPNGICYLLLERENKPSEVMRILKGLGLTSEIILQRRAQNELLCILRIQHETSSSSSERVFTNLNVNGLDSKMCS